MPAYPDMLRLQEARDRYFAANGFSLRSYQDPTFTMGLLGFKMRFPNINQRKRVVPFHDLHHVVTGYGTDWTGEAELGAWELRAGCNSFVAYFLNGGGFIIGLCIAPARTWQAFQRAKNQHTLYRANIEYDSLMRMSVGEVRNLLGIPSGGLA